MKSTLYLLVLLISTNCFAQVKIGNNPTVLNPSSLLELESTNKSLLISRVTDTNAISAPVNGMIIYDLSAKCFKGYQDGAWTDCGFVAYPKPNSVLIQVGNEADNPNVIPSVVTATQLASVPGVVGVITTNEKAYQTYIDANPNLFSAPATVAEVNAMLVAVNTNVNAILVQIGNEGDNPNVIPSVVTVAQITSLGVSCVIATSQTQYRAYIDANPNSFSSPATIAEVQAMTNTLAAFPPNSINCGASALITPGNSVSTTATGGDGGVITWSISPTTGVSTTSGTGLSTGAITFNTQGTYTLTYTATKTPPQGCGTTTTSTCSKTITVTAFTLSGTGFESSGTACLLNTTISTFNAAFSDGVCKGYVADVTPLSSGNFQLDIQGGTGCTTYGTAWSGNKFLGLAAGDGLTIDLGANLIPGSTFTMTMYERAPTLPSSPYRVGISNTAGFSGGSSYNNLFNTTGPTTNTWTARTITFTVPNVTGYRYLTIESTNGLGTVGWTCLDF
jgi:hypothetical protein